MAKNIVVFSDGTGQDGGVRAEQRMSNVYKMYRAARVGPENVVDPREQVAFYDPGLGTDAGATALSAPLRFVQKLLASVTGQGINRNIADCYAFILDHYEPGDRIYLVGFSRGAYTVRCIANLLMLCGIPTTTPSGPLRRFMKQPRDIAEEAVTRVLEQGAGQPRGKYEADRLEQARRFRLTYGSNAIDDPDPDASNAAPYFIGVFDTVAALGAKGFLRVGITAGLCLAAAAAIALVAGGAHAVVGVGFWKAYLGLAVATTAYGAWSWLGRHLKTTFYPATGLRRWYPRWHFAVWRAGFYDRLLSRSVRYARSANAIDETRDDFDRVPWGGTVRAREGDEPQPLLQLWFAGNHSDVGGSYPETESRLSDIALDWMVHEARSLPQPLILADDRLRRHPSADGVQHCEIAGMHDTIERRLWKWLRPLASGLNWPSKVREIRHDAPIHQTVRDRFAMERVLQCAGNGAYRPAALKDHDDFRRFYAAEVPLVAEGPTS